MMSQPNVFSQNDHIGSMVCPQNEPDPVDLSWLLIAVTRHGVPLIIDGAADFWDREIIVHGECAIDNGVVFPKDLDMGSLYLMENIKVLTLVNTGITNVRISGDWKKVFPPETNTRFDLLSGEGYEGG